MEANFTAWDELFDAGKAVELLPKLREALANDQKNPEILWRTSRCIFEIGTNEETAEAKKAKFEEALEVAKTCIAVAPEHWGGHKWCGICYGYLGDFVPTTEKIGNSFLIKKYFEDADRLSPDDGTIKHALGKWCYSVASIGMLERAAASTLFATPPTATYQEALDYYLAAEKLMEAQVVRYAGVHSTNTLYIGLTYEGLRDTAKAKEWFNKTIELPVTGPAQKTQNENKVLAKARLDAINSSWW